jgi:hypothetical protein
MFGTLRLGDGLGAACGPWLTGVIYDRTGSDAPAWWMALGLSGLSMLRGLPRPDVRVRWPGKSTASMPGTCQGRWV